MDIQHLFAHLTERGAIPGTSPVLDFSVSLSSNARVADAPDRAIVREADGNPIGVLFLANSVNPDLVARGVRNARSAKETLGAEEGAVILDPVVSGEYHGLSYALWPWCRSMSKSRYVAHMQRTLLRRTLFLWLRNVTARTKHTASDGSTVRHYDEALNTLIALEELSAEIRDRVRDGISRLRSGMWEPYHVLEHNDFWIGNVMLDRRGFRVKQQAYPFYVIDWAGARTSGYPILDLVRMSDSSGASRRKLTREIHLHCGILNCDTDDSVYYLLAALGYLRSTQEHFPMRRYTTVCHRMYTTLTAALGNGLSGGYYNHGGTRSA